ncbi:hypothetical protein GYB61_07080 [bacterium]|nr:hypothetical protein [bacterium]
MNKRPLFARHVGLLLLACVLAACSDDDPEGGLLASGGGNTGSDTSTPVLIALDGPTCVTAGQRSDLFTATVTNAGGTPVTDTFVGIEGAVGDEPAGTIRAIGRDGRERLGGANTNDNGVVRFVYVAPDGINISVSANLVAQVLDEDDLPRGDGETAIEVALPNRPSVSIRGPVNNAGNRIPSGALELDPGDLAADLLVAVSARDGCDNTVQAVSGAAVEFSTSPVVGAIRQTNDTTGIDGTLLFDYAAPATSTARQTVTITAEASNAGGTGAANYVLDVLPTPPDPFLRLTLDGPTSVVAGSSQSGYIVDLDQVQLDNDGNETVTAAADRRITLSSSDGGSFTTVDGGNGLSTTDDAGLLQFSFSPATSGTTAQIVQLTAAVNTTADTEAATLCGETGAQCSDVIDVSVQADTFQFTAPTFGESGLVGENNAVPLTINWRDGAGAGVTGCVNLSTTFDGSGNSAFGFVVNGDTVNNSSQRTNVRVVNGAFERTQALYSDGSGFVEVTAVDNRDCVASPTSSLTTSTGVQFQDVVCGGTDAENCVDLQAPLRSISSPDESGNQRTAELTLEVRNDAFDPIDGAQVTFEILTPANPGDPNERVFPGGGTTNANGIATSTYFVPTFNPPLGEDEIRTVDIEGCVRGAAASGSPDGAVCSTRRIEIVAPPTP